MEGTGSQIGAALREVEIYAKGGGSKENRGPVVAEALTCVVHGPELGRVAGGNDVILLIIS